MTNPRVPRLAAGFLGFLWFLQIGGGPTLNPANVAWLMTGDWLQHWLGWLFFRNEAWTFPLGTLTAVPYPIGSTIGFTDSNPIVSILLKPFSGALPAEFQFIGLWLALCFFLQGYIGAALVSTVTKDTAQQILAGYLVVLSPVLAGRIEHDTLCAQWLVLALLYFGLREYPDTASTRKALALSSGAVALAAGIHPYLSIMCWVLALALHARLWWDGLITRMRAIAAALATTSSMLAVFAVFGYFQAQRGVEGFGSYSADLLTLFNPSHFSRLLPALPMGSLQYEGMGFLGVGGLVAFAIAVIVFVRRRPSLRAGTWAILAAAVLLGLYALSAEVTFAGYAVVSLRWLYEPLMPVLEPFRASGRFIWPLHYLALVFGVWGVTRVFGSARQAAGTTLLALAVAVQAADVKVDPWLLSPKAFRQAPVKDFALAVGRYKHLALFPMHLQGVCHVSEDDHVYRYMLQAYRLGMTYNSGVFARLPAEKGRAECARLDQAVDAKVLDPQTIYVVASTHLPRMKDAGAVCGRFDGDWICVARNSDEAFRTLVETGVVIERGK